MNSTYIVEIVEYDAKWKDLFAAQAAQLRESLGSTAMRIDHIGSTSIVGLAAKPIIDVQISVGSLEPMKPYLAPLISLGYVWREDNPEKTKRYFRESPGSRRTHIHVRARGSWHEQYALLFRDYLRNSPEDCNRYESVKRQLAERYKRDRTRYTESKRPIFWEIMSRADDWAKTTGWEPGPTDA